MGGDLHQDGEGVVEVEVRSEGGGGGGETVVAHGGHHPVEEHGAGPDEDGGGPEQVEDSGRLDHRHVAHTVVILLLGLQDLVHGQSLVVGPGRPGQHMSQLLSLVLGDQPSWRLWQQPEKHHHHQQIRSREN